MVTKGDINVRLAYQYNQINEPDAEVLLHHLSLRALDSSSEFIAEAFSLYCHCKKTGDIIPSFLNNILKGVKNDNR